MFKNINNNHLTLLYLDYKFSIENTTKFRFCDHDQYYHEIFSNVDHSADKKHQIFTHISCISKVIKESNFTHFKDWHNFGNRQKFHGFAFSIYENSSVIHSFSKN